ncbi:uncharacterized protein [Ptychodera flava]|uniref:uncharacterized protein n=1 Tax=Ptychodera flava TaxID=63121 RepID=UPI00396A8A14
MSLSYNILLMSMKFLVVVLCSVDVVGALSLIKMNEATLYDNLQLQTCGNHSSYGVACNRIPFYPESMACSQNLQSLPDCLPMTECLRAVCRDVDPLCDWHEFEYERPDYCDFADAVQYMIDQKGVPSLGLPLNRTVKLMVELQTTYGIEFCDGYRVKCEEHLKGCVAFDEICQPGQYYNCYCNLGSIVEYINNIRLGKQWNDSKR